MRKTALITGASSGIGWEYAKVFAEEGYDVIITARRIERLNDLKQKLEEKYDVQVHSIAADLTQVEVPEGIIKDIHAKNLVIDVLVNNAGFGDGGFFKDSDLQHMTDMVQVNITALMQLTHLILPSMIKRGHGRIINISSMAGFVPGPMNSVYYASKAFVLSFSEALANELKGTGVFVTCQCPGPVKSEFQSVAYDQEKEKTLSQNIPTAGETARFGFNAMKRNKLIAITGWFNHLVPIMVRILPRFMIRNMVRSRQEAVSK